MIRTDVDKYLCTQLNHEDHLKNLYSFRYVTYVIFCMETYLSLRSSCTRTMESIDKDILLALPGLPRPVDNFYSNFTTLLRDLYDSAYPLWYPLRSLSGPPNRPSQREELPSNTREQAGWHRITGHPPGSTRSGYLSCSFTLPR